MDSEYKKQVQKIHVDFKQNKEVVIDYLVSHVLDVEIELPSNIRTGLDEEKLQ